MFRWLIVSVAVATGCLSDPGGGSTDAVPPTIDAATTVVDAAPPDAPVVEGGQAFPPADTVVNVTAGWAGDLNGDRFDDVVLLSDTGASDSAGAYVLLGGETGLPEFHQFMGTGVRDPIAVTAAQLDGAGNADVVVFAVDYGDGIVKETIESYLLAYMGDGAPLRATALENHVTSIRENWLFPRTEGEPADMMTGRFAPDAEVPGLTVIHHRGAFTLTMATWSDAAFEAFGTEPLLPSFIGSGGHVAPSTTATDLDDVVVYTSGSTMCRWMANQGDGSFAERIVESTPPGVRYGAPASLDGTDPVDFVGVRSSGLQGVPVDQNASTAGVLLDGATAVDGLGDATDIIAFDAEGTAAPEVVVSATGCSQTGSACLLLVPEVAVDGPAELATGTRRFFALPAGFTPRVLLRGDFDGDEKPEIRVFDASGQQQCVQVASGMLLPC